eukprot:4569630-Amphidinium_carterae.1
MLREPIWCHGGGLPSGQHLWGLDTEGAPDAVSKATALLRKTGCKVPWVHLRWRLARKQCELKGTFGTVFPVSASSGMIR